MIENDSSDILVILL